MQRIRDAVNGQLGEPCHSAIPSDRPPPRLWVPETRPWSLTCRDAGRSWVLVYRIIYRLLVGLARLAVRSRRSKDLEIIVLRHQLTVPRRQINRPALNNDDRALLGAVAAALRRPSPAGWLVTPDTLLRWHRRRIARHWTQPQRPPGRPPTSALLRQLTLRRTAENPTWGYRRVHGELAGLGHHLAASTVWQILNNAGIDPAPTPSRVTWSQFLRSQAAVACDFAAIDTVTLRRTRPQPNPHAGHLGRVTVDSTSTTSSLGVSDATASTRIWRRCSRITSQAIGALLDH